MIENPTAVELVEAVLRFITERCAPALKDRDAFLARVAVNALGVVGRELKDGAALETETAAAIKRLLGDADSEGALCQAIRDGAFDGREPHLLATLDPLIRDQVRIDQPRYSGLAALLDSPPRT